MRNCAAVCADKVLSCVHVLHYVHIAAYNLFWEYVLGTQKTSEKENSMTARWSSRKTLISK